MTEGVPVMTNDNDVGSVFGIEDLDDVAADETRSISYGIGGLCSTTVTKHIGCDDAVTLLLEEGDLMSPVVG